MNIAIEEPVTVRFEKISDSAIPEALRSQFLTIGLPKEESK